MEDRQMLIARTIFTSLQTRTKALYGEGYTVMTWEDAEPQTQAEYLGVAADVMAIPDNAGA